MKNKKGYTLIELLFGLTVIATVCIGLLFGGFVGYSVYKAGTHHDGVRGFVMEIWEGDNYHSKTSQ